MSVAVDVKVLRIPGRRAAICLECGVEVGHHGTTLRQLRDECIAHAPLGTAVDNRLRALPKSVRVIGEHQIKRRQQSPWHANVVRFRFTLHGFNGMRSLLRDRRQTIRMIHQIHRLI